MGVTRSVARPMGGAGSIDMATTGRCGLIPGQRRGSDGKPRLYLVPPLPADDLDDQPAPRDMRYDEAELVPSSDSDDTDADRAEQVDDDWQAQLRLRLPVHSSEPPTRRPEPGDPRPRAPWPPPAPRPPRARPPRTTRNRPSAAMSRDMFSASSRGRVCRSVRLTRRGRIVVSLFLLGLMTGIAMLLAPAIQASTPPGPTRTVVVEPGDTLWSISTSALPSEDPYQAVDQVRRLNHMHDDSIFVGQQLTLPPAH
jgi:hypothetical protein